VTCLWAATFLVIFVRLALTSQHNIFQAYERAGVNWLAGADLYTTTHGRGFVYSPLVAAFFAGLSLLPSVAANIVWRLLNAAVFLGAVFSWLGSGINRIPKKHWALVFLFLQPLSLGNFNNGQANPVVIGLLMFGILGAGKERWNLAAFCVAGAVYMKIYPLAAGLLLALVFPRKFAWRLAAALLVLGAAPFLFQKPSYVLAQYHDWIQTRLADDRRLYESNIAPHDLWMVLRALRVPISESAYVALEFLSAGAIAAVCLLGRMRNWPPNRLLGALFTLACCWMVLLGPATESPTYILLAPAAVFAAVQAFEEPRPVWLRALAAAALFFFIEGFAINSFVLKKEPFAVVQPVGAIIFSCYAGLWFLTASFWARRDEDFSMGLKSARTSARAGD